MIGFERSLKNSLFESLQPYVYDSFCVVGNTIDIVYILRIFNIAYGNVQFTLQIFKRFPKSLSFWLHLLIHARKNYLDLVVHLVEEFHTN